MPASKAQRAAAAEKRKKAVALALAGMDWQSIVAIGGVLLFGAVVVVLLRQQVIATIKGIREVVEA